MYTTMYGCKFAFVALEPFASVVPLNEWVWLISAVLVVPVDQLLPAA
jgi:hypothetical protein